MRRIMLLASVPFLMAAAPDRLLLGLDGKTFFTGDTVRIGPGGHDALVTLDISDPAHPKIAGQIPLANTVFGPPTNLQITPDGKLGLVANSILTTQKDGSWTSAPDDTLHVIDMTAQPPQLLETIKVGRQPSGIAIAHDGRFALVANRAGKSVSMLRIEDRSVQLAGEVALPDQAAAVAIAPDGRRAYVAMNLLGTVGVLTIEEGRLAYDKSLDIPTGPGVYNLDITPDGRTLVAANTSTDGNGSATTLAVIDTSGASPHVVSFATVSQGPEGLAISPNGKWVASPQLNGSSALRTAPGYHPTGTLQVFALDGHTLTLADTVALGAIPEAVAWSPDSHWLYVGNYNEKTLQVFELENDKLAERMKLPLPGQPASLRGVAR